MNFLIPTGEMTLGPFFPREFAQDANDLTQQGGGPAKGEVVEITGRVTQEGGAPLDNVVIEIWHASADGRFDDPAFSGWGRAATDAGGVYRFRTIKPGAYEGRAPHVNVLIVYSGLMRQLQTVLFFEGEEGNDEDLVFKAVPPARRERLVARKIKSNCYGFDIHLRGEGETPFFDD